jgi:uncharacterized membrane protein
MIRRKASTRVLIAALTGIAAAVAAVAAGLPDYAASLGWDAAALVFLVWTWTVIGPMDARDTASHATREDPTKRVTSVIVLGAAIASLVGVGFLLVQASSRSGAEKGLVAALGVASVAVSWFVIHTLFTLRYALLYYSACRVPGSDEIDIAAAGTRAGVDFNQDDPPQYTDFGYLAFTIGMTFQVSDTDLSTHAIRATALRHALLSFLFGSLILGASVNLVASLASSGH